MTLYDELFSYSALELVLSDDARIKGMLQFEAALARAEARTGVIPEGSAAKIADQCKTAHFDLSLIAKEAAAAGNLAIPLVKMLTEAVARQDKDAARFVHWGATSQDAIDTGFVLQLRDALKLIDADLARPEQHARGACQRPSRNRGGRPHLDAAGFAHDLWLHCGGLAGCNPTASPAPG